MSFQQLMPIRGGSWTLTYGTRYNVDGDGSVQLVVEIWRAQAATVALKADGDDSDLASRMVVDGWDRDEGLGKLPPADEEGIESVR